MSLPPPPEIFKFQHYQNFVLDIVTKEYNGTAPTKQLYEHQTEALLKVKKYFDESRQPISEPAIVVAPTGAGKTGIITLLPYVLGSTRVMVLSPSLIITDQLERAFGLRNGTVTESFVSQRSIVEESHLNDFLEIGKRVEFTEEIWNMKRWNLIIVNAQKFGATSSTSIVEYEEDGEEQRAQLVKLSQNFEKFSTLIVDEAHHFPAETWDLIVKKFVSEQGKQVVFLTAYPFRGREREPLFDGQQATVTIDKGRLIDLNIIRPLRFELISNCEEVKYGIIGSWIMKKLREHDKQEAAINHKAMVLVTTTYEAKRGSIEVSKATSENIATYYVSGSKTEMERNFKKFEDGKSRILFVCGRLLEGNPLFALHLGWMCVNFYAIYQNVSGYDNPDVSVCVILRKVGVLGLFIQFVGRCIRRSKSLPGNRIDPVEAIVASIPEFEQDKMFEEYESNP
jgi:superfamily II DNA or RNA helicase